jgi:hypothetical protein
MKYKIYYAPEEDAQDVQTHVSDVNDLGYNSQQLKADKFNIIRVEAMPETQTMPSAAPAVSQDAPTEPVKPAPMNPYQFDSEGAFGRGFGQGLSMGFADELSDNTDVSRAKNELAEQGSPVAYSIGEFLGEIPASLGIAGGVKKIGAKLATTGLQMGAPTIAKTGAQLATSPLANAVTSGAIEGAIGGAGRATEGKRTEGAGKGALIGAGSAAVGDVIGKYLIPKPQMSMLSDKADAAFKSVEMGRPEITGKQEATRMVRSLWEPVAQDTLNLGKAQINTLMGEVEGLKRSLRMSQYSDAEKLAMNAELKMKTERIKDLENQLAPTADLMAKRDAGEGALNENVRSINDVRHQLGLNVDVKLGEGSSVNTLDPEALSVLEKIADNKLIDVPDVIQLILKDDESIRKMMTEKAYRNLQEKLVSLPTNVAAPLATSAAQATRSDRFKLPEPQESLLSPRDYVKKLDRERLEELLRIIDEDGNLK